MRLKTLFVLLVFSILSLSSCKYFKKCEGVEDIYVEMDSETNAFFHFQPGERMVFTNGHGVYDTAYWGETVRYYDKSVTNRNFSCIGRKGDCCAKAYYQMAEKPLRFTSGDKNKPTKMHSTRHLVGFPVKGQGGLYMYNTAGERANYKGVIYDDFCLDQNVILNNDTNLAYSISKGILFLRIKNDDKTITKWERVF